MTPLIGAVFIASLLGSLHCAGMCGAFLLFAVGGPPGAGAKEQRAALHTAYHLGRLATYATLGAIAGALGAALDLAGSMAGLSRGAAVLAGALLVGAGIIAILRLQGVRIGKPPVPKAMERLLMKGHRFASGKSPLVRAGMTGLLTTLLPCGWLYAFVITAAGTGHPLDGAATMAVFWIGTLPVLIAVGVGVQRAAGALGRRLPLITALAVVAIGLFTVWTRATGPGFEAMHAAIPVKHARSAAEAAAQIGALDSSDLPCCHDGD